MGGRGDAGRCPTRSPDCRVAAILAMTTGETYARASLAWLGPLRSALPVAASVILPSRAPLLAGFETYTEAKVGRAGAGNDAVAVGGTQTSSGAIQSATVSAPGRTR